jgi:hypothetical protein
MTSKSSRNDGCAAQVNFLTLTSSALITAKRLQLKQTRKEAAAAAADASSSAAAKAKDD